ncbi:MAG: hypothetical protein AB1486_26885 [Planctomycetota bacterium]
MQAASQLLAVLVLALTVPESRGGHLLVHPDGLESDAGFRLALGDLEQAFAHHNLTCKAVAATTLGEAVLPPGSVVVSRTNPLVQRWITEGRLPETDLKEDDHLLRTLPVTGGRAIVVMGGSLRGDLYGLFYLAERIRLDPEEAFRTSILRRPAFELRLVSGESPENALRLGYNAVFLNAEGVAGEATLSATLKEWDKGIVAKDDALARATRRNRVFITSLLDKVKALHLQYFGGGREPEFPTALLQSEEVESLTHDGDSGVLCLSKPACWQMLAAKYAEAADLIGRFDGYVIQEATSPLVSSDGLFAASPAYDIPGPSFPPLVGAGCATCRGESYESTVGDLIASLRAMVRRAGPEKFVYRAYQPSTELAHSDPQVYRSLTAQLKDTTGLWIALKETQTDFWEYGFPNPCLGEGPIAQIVEFDCERRHEGRGAWPSFVGERAARTYRYCKSRGVRGIWNHHHGGIGRPTPGTDLWNRANAYVAAHLMWDPELDAQALGREWAAIAVTPDGADSMAELLRISERVARKWRYVEAYSRDHWSFLPAAGLLQGDALGGQPFLDALYAASPFGVDAMLREKDEAVSLATRMLELVEMMRPSLESSPLSDAIRNLKPPPELDAREPLALARYFGTGEVFREEAEGSSSGHLPGDACRLVPSRLVARLPTERAGRSSLRLTYDHPVKGGTKTVRERELQDRLLEVTEENTAALLPAIAYHHYQRDDFEVRLVFESPRQVAVGAEAWATITVIRIDALSGEDWIEPHLTAIAHESGAVTDLPLELAGRVDQTPCNAIRSGIRHLQSVASLVRDGMGAYLLNRRFHENGDPDDRSEALSHAKTFLSGLHEYRDEVAALAGSPSILDVSSLESVVERLRDELERSTPVPDDWSTLDVLAAAGLESTRMQWAAAIAAEVKDSGRIGRLRRAQIASAAMHQAYRRQVVKSFIESIGGLPERSSLAYREEPPRLERGYQIRRVVYQSLPGIHVTANVYEPSGLTDRPALVLCCDEDDEGKAAPRYQTLAVGLARRGYVVLILDPLGQGERRESYDPVAGAPMLDSARLERSFAALRFELAGQRLDRQLAWDVVRSIDYLCTLRSVDHARIAVLGVGRGTLTAIDAALVDERIGIAILIDPPGSLAEGSERGLASGPSEATAGSLRAGNPIDWPDRLTALASRQLHLVLTPHPVNGEAGLTVEALPRLNARRGKADSCRVTTIGEEVALGPQAREAVYQALVSSFGRTPEPLQDEPLVSRPCTELRCTATGQVTSSLEAATTSRRLLVQRAKELAEERRNKSRDRNARIANVLSLTGVRPIEAGVPSNGIASTRRDTLRLERLVIDPASHSPIPAILVRPVGAGFEDPLPATIYASDRGKALAAAPGGIAELLAREGRAVLLADIRGVGELALPFGSPADVAGSYEALLYGTVAAKAREKSLVGGTYVGDQATDLARCLSALRARDDIRPDAISLHALRQLTLPALLAALADEGVQSLTLEGGLASFESVVGAELFEVSPALFVPDILRYEDIPDLLGLLAPRPLHVIAPVDARQRELDESALRELFRVTERDYGYADASHLLRIDRVPVQAPEARR